MDTTASCCKLTTARTRWVNIGTTVQHSSIPTSNGPVPADSIRQVMVSGSVGYGNEKPRLCPIKHTDALIPSACTIHPTVSAVCNVPTCMTLPLASGHSDLKSGRMTPRATPGPYWLCWSPGYLRTFTQSNDGVIPAPRLSCSGTTCTYTFPTPASTWVRG